MPSTRLLHLLLPPLRLPLPLLAPLLLLLLQLQQLSLSLHLRLKCCKRVWLAGLCAQQQVRVAAAASRALVGCRAMQGCCSCCSYCCCSCYVVVSLAHEQRRR